jgi:prepilin-type processing-associated H-X9-DG protein
MNMNITKAKAFNDKMGKAKHYPRHQNLSKGGMVDKRKHFDAGGVTGNTTQQGNLGSLAEGAGAGAATGAAIGSVVPVLGTAAGAALGAITGAGPQLASFLTPQSQYQANLAPTTNYDYSNSINAGASTALNPTAVNQAIGAEQGIAGQYGNIASGNYGPTGNPALTQLAQTTGTNVANTAALQAGQRGSAANVGLAARQIGQTGAATQQNAVGQAATQTANQSLGALGQEGTIQNQIATQGLGEQGVGANVLATGAGANNAQNTTNVSNYGMAQGLNQSTAGANAAATQKTAGGLLGGLGSALSFLDKGGEVQKFDAGGPTLGVDTTLNPNNGTIAAGNVNSPSSVVGNFLKGNSSKGDSDPTGLNSLGSGIGNVISGGSGGGDEAMSAIMARGGRVHPGPHKSHVANYLFADGGTAGGKDVPALVSAKEVYLNPHQVHEVVERGADPMKIGHHFPGSDKVKKNSEKNDVIPVTLEDGGVVLPISVTTHKDASQKGRKFVERAHAKRYLKKPKGI